MKMLAKKNLCLKNHVLLLTLLPSLLITTALTTYLILSRQADAQESLITNVTTIINNLAKASELALFSGDRQELDRLAKATVMNKMIKSVTFFNSQKNEMVTKGKKEEGVVEGFVGGVKERKVYVGTTFYQEEQNDQWIIQVPVYNTEIEVDDFPTVDVVEDNNKPIPFLGWVQINADKTRLKEKQRSILRAGAGIGMFVFTLLAFLALRFARSISLPLEKITEAVKQLESGDLTARVNVLAKGEMRNLVHGINLLADKVETSNETLQKNVDSATSKLTLALDDLEQLNQKLRGNVIQEREQREEQEQMLLRQCRMASMGEMLDSIAHQWRQPLMHINSILLNMDNALETGKRHTEEQGAGEANKKYLENKIDEVAALTTHMSQTIEDFRGLFKQQKEQTTFLLESAIEDVLALMKNVFNNIDVEYQPEANLAIEGHRSELIQVIVIVLSNAVDALNKYVIKNKKIIIKSQSSKNKVLISIEDNAGGIHPEILSSIFDPYFTTKEQTGGTGLGLYIAKIIIEQNMGAKLEATNIPDGALFSIVLQRVDER